MPSARLEYETILGDPMVDESTPVELTVIYGQLTVSEPNIIAPHLVNEGGIYLSVNVLDADGVTPVNDATVYGVIDKEVTSRLFILANDFLGWILFYLFRHLLHLVRRAGIFTLQRRLDVLRFVTAVFQQVIQFDVTHGFENIIPYVFIIFLQFIQEVFDVPSL